MKNPYEQYRAASIETSTPGEIIVLLYDEAILAINKAITSLNQHRIEETHRHIMKAENIITYLMENLDTDYPIGKQLLSIYEFVYGQLVNANIKKDGTVLPQMVQMLEELKDAWKKAEAQIHVQNKKDLPGGASV